MGGIYEAIITRLKASAYGLISRAIAYLSGAVALVFILAGLFIWLAREESLVFACLVFASLFTLIALGAVIGVFVFRRRHDRVEISKTQLGFSVLANPAMASLGLGLARRMRRAPKMTLGLALAVGIAIAMLGHRGASAEPSKQA